MAILAVLLVLFLPCTALAAFTPDFAVFLACGAASNVSFPSDSPARTFTPDGPFLASSRSSAVNANSNPASPLYAAARASASVLSYKFAPPAGQFLVLRLHFFPFAAPSQSPSLSSARFTVSVLDAYTLLSNFSPPSAGVVKEFFVPAAGSDGGDFRVALVPDTGSSCAFVNAVELFSAPAELLWNQRVTPVGDSNSNVSAWQQGALETAFRLNVGGPAVTAENGTLWRTWLPDALFLSGPPGLSVVNSTTNPVFYPPGGLMTREVAPDAVYSTQRASGSWCGRGGKVVSSRRGRRRRARNRMVGRRAAAA